MDKSSRTGKTIICMLAGFAIVGVAAVVGLSAAAAGTAPSGSISDSSQPEPQLKSSITVPEAMTEQSDSQEAVDLAARATIDSKTAENAATTSMAGSTATASHLGEENGSLTYEVTVKDDTGNLHELKVDAGNGKVLTTETVDQQENGIDTPDADSPDAK